MKLCKQSEEKVLN